MSLSLEDICIQNSYISWDWKTAWQESDSRSLWLEGRTEGEKKEKSNTCCVLDKAVSGSLQHLQSKQQEDMSFESKEGKNSSVTV